MYFPYKFHFRLSLILLGFALLLFPLPSNRDGGHALEAQTIPSSGYSGFFSRIQAGVAYSELIEDYENKDREYFGHGPHLAAQLGWAVSKSHAFHLNLSAFSTSKVFGPDRQERLTDDIGETKHKYFLGGAGLGFTWFHIPTAVYISPVVNLFQAGLREESQRINDRSSSDEYSLHQLKTSYNSRIGYGLIVGNDRWISKSTALGFSLAVYHSHMLIEKQTYKITTEPAGTKRESREEDLGRVSARDILTALSLSITFN